MISAAYHTSYTHTQCFPTLPLQRDLARLWITLTILGCRVHTGSGYCHVELSPSAICALHFTCKSPHNIMTSPGTITETSMEIYRAHPLIRTDIWILVWRPLNDKSGLAYCCMLHIQPADNSFCSNWFPYLCCSQDWWRLMHRDSSKSTVWRSGWLWASIWRLCLQGSGREGGREGGGKGSVIVFSSNHVCVGY